MICDYAFYRDYLADRYGIELDSDVPAHRVVMTLFRDVTGRGGFDGLWDGLDFDVRREIIESWLYAVEDALKP